METRSGMNYTELERYMAEYCNQYLERSNRARDAELMTAFMSAVDDAVKTKMQDALAGIGDGSILGLHCKSHGTTRMVGLREAVKGIMKLSTNNHEAVKQLRVDATKINLRMDACDEGMPVFVDQVVTLQAQVDRIDKCIPPNLMCFLKLMEKKIIEQDNKMDTLISALEGMKLVIESARHVVEDREKIGALLQAANGMTAVASSKLARTEHLLEQTKNLHAQACTSES